MSQRKGICICRSSVAAKGTIRTGGLENILLRWCGGFEPSQAKAAFVIMLWNRDLVLRGISRFPHLCAVKINSTAARYHESSWHTDEVTYCCITFWRPNAEISSRYMELFYPVSSSNSPTLRRARLFWTSRWIRIWQHNVCLSRAPVRWSFRKTRSKI